MTSVILTCKATEDAGMEFQIKFGQEDPTNEEKSAALFMMPYVKNALELAMKEAEDRNKTAEEGPKIDEPLDGGPKIITLD